MKCRSWRSCASCRWTIAKRAVAHGPSRQGSSWKRWACANCGSQDRSFDIIGATHTETLPIRRIEKFQTSEILRIQFLLFFQSQNHILEHNYAASNSFFHTKIAWTDLWGPRSSIKLVAGTVTILHWQNKTKTPWQKNRTFQGPR